MPKNRVFGRSEGGVTDRSKQNREKPGKWELLEILYVK